MGIIHLSFAKLGITALLIVIVVIINIIQQLKLTKSIIISALRTIIQLFIIGFVLEALFTNPKLLWVVLLAFTMLLVASHEAIARQEKKFSGGWSYAFSTFSLLIATFGVAIFALNIIINAKPWYQPQYAIPLLGMITGNAMTSISLSLNQLTKTVWQQRSIIEQRLLLGQSAKQAIADIHRDCIRTGMIPSINAMAVAGIVSLPGMMTGQILAGISPIEAVKYQIMIMFLLTAASSFGIIIALRLSCKRLFDERQRLRLDRLQA
jgi:putative ABC transport system permease protein